MANLFRLALSAVVVFLFATSSALAAFPATSGYVWAVNGYPDTQASTVLLSMNKWASDRQVSLRNTYPSCNVNTGSPTDFGSYQTFNPYTGNCGGNTFPTQTVTRSGNGQYTCPSNSLLTGSTCTCNSGFNEVGGACVNASQAAKCSAAKGGSDWFSGFTSLPTVGGSFCPSDGAASQCGTAVTGGYCTVKNGVRSCSYEVKYDGSTCTPPANSNTSAPDPCKGSSGTVNGVTVCIPLGSDPSVTVESKSGSTTSGTSGGASTGSSSTDKATSCTGATCTTTTTTTTTSASGAVTTSAQTKTEPKDDFCVQNPQSLICKQSAWSGSCAGAFTCSGDAVQCALSKEVHTRNCSLFDKQTLEGALFDAQKDKTGSQVTNEDKTIGASSFDTTDALGGGSCITDKQITVMGWTGSLPFSVVCPHLAVLGNILLLVSFLLAGRIVARG